jgi:putative acetyltransferase
MDNLTFRPFSPADQAEVKDLVLGGLVDHWGVLDPAKNPDLEDIFTSYAGATFLVARLAGRVVGAAEIVRMSVARDLRRRGLGRRILTCLVEQARRDGLSRVVLETTATWQEVIDFYLDYGFRITHFADGDVYFAMDLDG